MLIAIDAMGGDHAPLVNVEGAVQAVREYPVTIALTGRMEVLQPVLTRFSGQYPAGTISIVEAPEEVAMSESPAQAVRRKKKSSMAVALDLVRAGTADAAISAGNSGAMMAYSIFMLKRLPTIDRPAIATIMPTVDAPFLLIDAGANVDCKPSHLVQFGVMGSIYARNVMHVPNPRVGLLSNGEEEEKGTDLTRETHELLRGEKINYIGYVEGRDVFAGACDVVVCDGFTGNVLLKVAEGVAHAFTTILKSEVAKSPLSKLGFLMAMPALKALKKKIDYEEYGGAPLLGVDGVSIICHGSSSARAIKNAVRNAREEVECGFNTLLRSELERRGDGAVPETLQEAIQ